MDEDCLNSVFFYFKKRKEAEQKVNLSNRYYTLYDVGNYIVLGDYVGFLGVKKPQLFNK